MVPAARRGGGGAPPPRQAGTSRRGTTLRCRALPGRFVGAARLRCPAGAGCGTGRAGAAQPMPQTGGTSAFGTSGVSQIATRPDRRSCPSAPRWKRSTIRRARCSRPSGSSASTSIRIWLQPARMVRSASIRRLSAWPVCRHLRRPPAGRRGARRRQRQRLGGPARRHGRLFPVPLTPCTGVHAMKPIRTGQVVPGSSITMETEIPALLSSSPRRALAACAPARSMRCSQARRAGACGLLRDPERGRPMTPRSKASSRNTAR